MTGTPTDPDDPNLTTLYDPPPPAQSAGPPAGRPEAQVPVPPPATPDDPQPDVPATPAAAAPPAPAWRTRHHDSGRTGTIVFGVVLVAIGLWFFADQTLGLDMPRLSWSDLWPILIIALGGWIVLGSLRRGT